MAKTKDELRKENDEQRHDLVRMDQLLAAEKRLVADVAQPENGKRHMLQVDTGAGYRIVTLYGDAAKSLLEMAIIEVRREITYLCKKHGIEDPRYMVGGTRQTASEIERGLARGKIDDNAIKWEQGHFVAGDTENGED